MKKLYMNPDVVVVALDAMDIVTASEHEEDLWQPTGSNKDWSSILGGYTKIN